MEHFFSVSVVLPDVLSVVAGGHCWRMLSSASVRGRRVGSSCALSCEHFLRSSSSTCSCPVDSSPGAHLSHAPLPLPQLSYLFLALLGELAALLRN